MTDPARIARNVNERRHPPRADTDCAGRQQNPRRQVARRGRVRGSPAAAAAQRLPAGIPTKTVVRSRRRRRVSPHGRERSNGHRQPHPPSRSPAATPSTTAASASSLASVTAVAELDSDDRGGRPERERRAEPRPARPVCSATARCRQSERPSAQMPSQPMNRPLSSSRHDQLGQHRDDAEHADESDVPAARTQTMGRSATGHARLPHAASAMAGVRPRGRPG